MVKTIQDRPDYGEEEELRRALGPKCQDRKREGRSHEEKLEEDDPDLAFAVAASMEEYRVHLPVPRVATRRRSEENLQEVLEKSRRETKKAQEQKDRGESKDGVPSPLEVLPRQAHMQWINPQRSLSPPHHPEQPFRTR